MSTLVQRMAASMKLLIETIQQSDTSQGYCCCGDSIEKHSNPMYCGHSPVDMGDYYAAKAVEEAQALLAEFEKDEL